LGKKGEIAQIKKVSLKDERRKKKKKGGSTRGGEQRGKLRHTT